MKTDHMRRWTVEDATRLYAIDHWGNEYFQINEKGHVSIHPTRQKSPSIDFYALMEEVHRQGIGDPVVFRFQDILCDRVVLLNKLFQKTIEEAHYQGVYRGVYPVKANPVREVVEEVLEAGRAYHFGIEVGSKAELAAVLPFEMSSQSLLICNGYKDEDFIRLALLGRKLGKKVFLVIEKISELFLILRLAQQMKVHPLLGVRVKLHTRGSGKWEASGGELAKFGLTSPELLYVVKVLKEKGFLESFQLLHFHIGSQVSHILTIQRAVQEGARIYSKLRKVGVPLAYLDIGGGLGVDYDGSRTNFESSVNYSLKEYVADIVYSVQEICESEKVPEPHLVTESGRAIAAYHSVLVVRALGALEVGATPFPLDAPDEERSDIVMEMEELLTKLSKKNLLEYLNDALRLKEEAMNRFHVGILSLKIRAQVEFFFWKICKNILKLSKELRYVPEDIENLKKHLADQYLCNFSLFQSLPDYWAIEQLFPIIPLQRHLERPDRKMTMVDITCDSDGKISKFIDLRDVLSTLPVHAIERDQPYYLGIFLVGAYQDIMGDLHNCFGRVNEVHVFVDESEPSGYYLEENISGSDVGEVLSWIQYSPAHMFAQVKKLLEQRAREQKIKPSESVALSRFYEKVLKSYTYLNAEDPFCEEVKRSPEVSKDLLWNPLTVVVAQKEKQKDFNTQKKKTEGKML